MVKDYLIYAGIILIVIFIAIMGAFIFMDDIHKTTPIRTLFNMITSYNYTKINGDPNKILTVYFSFNSSWSKIFAYYVLPLFIKDNFTIILKPIDIDNKSIYFVCMAKEGKDLYKTMLFLYKNYNVTACKDPDVYNIVKDYRIQFLSSKMYGVPAVFIITKKNINITRINDVFKRINIKFNPVVYNGYYIFYVPGVLPLNYTEFLIHEVS